MEQIAAANSDEPLWVLVCRAPGNIAAKVVAQTAVNQHCYTLPPAPIRIADNGVTFVCPTAHIGYFGEVNDLTCEVEDDLLLRT